MSSHFKITAWEGSQNIQICAAVSSIFLDGEDVKKLEEFFAPRIRKDEREKVIDLIQAECNNDIMHFSNKGTFEDPDRSGWLKAVFSIRDRAETLRQQEQPK